MAVVILEGELPLTVLKRRSLTLDSICLARGLRDMVCIPSRHGCREMVGSALVTLCQGNDECKGREKTNRKFQMLAVFDIFEGNILIFFHLSSRQKFRTFHDSQSQVHYPGLLFNFRIEDIFSHL